ncbi:GNAT family N-acetyltransferase [soil metagenome]
MELSIRAIEPKDLAAVVSLLREFAEFEKLSEYVEVTEESLWIAMFGESPVVEGLIVHNAEEAAGYALFYRNFSSFRGQLGLHLEDIYVKPEYRGRSIGEMMLREIASIAADRGFERIDFNVLDWNQAAIDFYFRHGAVRNDDERHFKFAGEAFRSLSF